MKYLTATLYLLSLLVVIVNSQQGDYQKFLNHGFKSGQMSKELSKLKVDVLGKMLKKHVTQLRSGNQLREAFQKWRGGLAGQNVTFLNLCPSISTPPPECNICNIFLKASLSELYKKLTFTNCKQKF